MVQVKPGDTVTIIGAGPVGLAALLTAQFYAPAVIIVIDLDDNRLEVAKQFGATMLINSADGRAVEKIMALTGGRGVEVAIEAVGVCGDVRPLPGNHRSGRAHRQHRRAWRQRKLASRKALVPKHHHHHAAGGTPVTTPLLLKTIMAGKLQPKRLITHHFALNDIIRAPMTPLATPGGSAP